MMIMMTMTTMMMIGYSLKVCEAVCSGMSTLPLLVTLIWPFVTACVELGWDRPHGCQISFLAVLLLVTSLSVRQTFSSLSWTASMLCEIKISIDQLMYLMPSKILFDILYFLLPVLHKVPATSRFLQGWSPKFVVVISQINHKYWDFQLDKHSHHWVSWTASVLCEMKIPFDQLMYLMPSKIIFEILYFCYRYCIRYRQQVVFCKDGAQSLWWSSAKLTHLCLTFHYWNGSDVVVIYFLLRKVIAESDFSPMSASR